MAVDRSMGTASVKAAADGVLTSAEASSELDSSYGAVRYLSSEDYKDVSAATDTSTESYAKPSVPGGTGNDEYTEV
jgi:hypothetical protein